ncbi:uncharacterized protein SRS1_11443 [Sporisorium reilianum f. sp. reilianum]|uniref:Uncharacterized protein n=1 Tax=Sporisorium reilianum f. sp. reilianum TaxID=72559 RepID=A0A2N8U607_9BASI|nr:uncharacterized protein SRS1_11443 [Sporisorium reilianum f. sp. reilianum]
MQTSRRVENHFQNNPAMLAMQSDVDNLYQEMADTFHQPEVSPKALSMMQNAQHFLRSFLKEVHLKCTYGEGGAVGVDDFLGTRPPRCDLSINRVFWKALASFVVLRIRPDHITGKTKRSSRTSLSEFKRITTEYKKLTGKEVDKEIQLECEGVIEANAVEHEAEKPIATFSNLASFIKTSVFGDQFVLRCAREEVQLAAVHLIIAVCAVRPGEVNGSYLKHGKLHWCDVKFYISLQDDWLDDEEEDSHETADTAITEDTDFVNPRLPAKDTNVIDPRLLPKDAHVVDLRLLPATDSVDAADSGATISSPSGSRYRLHCDILFLSLKKGRKRQARWRQQPL